jgi:hypothetical protein
MRGNVNENFYLGAYWGARRESADECAVRLANFLSRVGEQEHMFGRWHILIPRAGSPPVRQRDLTSGALTETLLQGRNRRDDDGTVIEDLGLLVSLGTDDGDEDLLRMSVKCGAFTPFAANSCVIEFPRTGPSRERLLTATAARALMHHVSAAWRPDWAVVTSDPVRERHMAQHGRSWRLPFVPWMLYLSKARGTVPPLRAPATSEVVHDGIEAVGSLITVTPEPMNSENSEHIEAGERVRMVLDAGGLLHPTQ